MLLMQEINLKNLPVPFGKLRFCHLLDNIGKVVFNKQLRFFALSFSIKYKCQISGGNAPIGYFDFDRAISPSADENSSILVVL